MNIEDAEKIKKKSSLRAKRSNPELVKKHFPWIAAIPYGVSQHLSPRRWGTTRLFLIFFYLLTQNSYGAPALRIVGSSAVFPFAATVAEHFNYKTHGAIPIIEAIGTGAGIKLFCGNIKGPDGVITSRPLTKKEEEKCKDNGITFQGLIIGQDGLVLIQNKQAVPFSMSVQNLDQTLSEKVLLGKKCIPNPHKEWNQIQATLPAYPIRVLGPSPSTGTYDILIEKLKNTCGPFIRHDGAYIEAPANENLIVQKVLSRSDTIGIVTFSFYDQNKTRLQAIPLNKVLPSVISIQDKSYPLSRPLYLYIKTNDLAHHEERRAYALEFTSMEAIGEKGYLTEKGLIPLSPQEQREVQDRALHLQEDSQLSKVNTHRHCETPQGAKQSRFLTFWIASAPSVLRNDDVTLSIERRP